MNFEKFKINFKNNGFCVLKGVLDETEVNRYRQHLEKSSGVSSKDFFSNNAVFKTFAGKKVFKLWAKPNGAVEDPVYWDLLLNKKISSICGQLLGGDVKFLQHNDLHAGFSAYGWHRDSVDREFGTGEDWFEMEKYSIVRVGIYLQDYKESGFTLGFLPGTHLKCSKLLAFEVNLRSSMFGLGRIINFFKARIFFQKIFSWENIWVKPCAGDIVFFDPRVMHAGGDISGPKYSIFLCYGLPNKHFYRYREYFTKYRTDLKYQPMARELIQKLSESNLLPEEKEYNGSMNDAWVPPGK